MIRSQRFRRLLAPFVVLFLAGCAASGDRPRGEPAGGGENGPGAQEGAGAERLTGAAPSGPGEGEPDPGGESRTGEPEDGDAEEDGPQPAEIATVGWDGLTRSPVVLVRELGTGRVVPIWVGVAEARAIASALHGVEFPRPMSHDLMRDLVAGLGGAVESLHIHDIRDGTYYGELTVRLDGREEPVLVDTRPSDGMALALRTGAEIFLSRTVLDQTPDIDFLAPEPGEQVVNALGLTLVVPTEAHRREHELPDRPGLLVTRAAGPAAEEGLERGDLVLEVNGVEPETPMDFLDVLREAPPVAPVAVTYWRDGEERSVKLLPDPDASGERPDGPVA
ncbi:MAG: bifunctional nuclease domain-containing protein [Thermoanaerobaculia bacterium]